MSLLEIAAALFIISWVGAALMGVGGFLLNSPPLKPYPPGRPGEWKEGVRNIAIGLGVAGVLYWFA